jgi:hypothetical protein
MKNYLLAAGLLLAGLGAQAQNTIPLPPATPPSFRYAILSELGNRWHLDYGQDAKPAITNVFARDDNAVIEKMQSEVAALDYLDSRGWEYVNHTTYSGNTFSGRTKYLLRQRFYRP